LGRSATKKEYEYISLISNFWKKKLKCRGLLSKLGFFMLPVHRREEIVENSQRILLTNSKESLLCTLHGKTTVVLL
jgi:hypothetical protein